MKHIKKMIDQELTVFEINTEGKKYYIPNFGQVNAGFPSPAEVELLPLGGHKS